MRQPVSDGATDHTTKATIQLLKQILGKGIISHSCGINYVLQIWQILNSTHATTLTSRLKKVYAIKPQTLQQLMDNIQTEMKTLQPETMREVMENTLERARLCEAENWCHLKYKFIYLIYSM